LASAAAGGDDAAARRDATKFGQGLLARVRTAKARPARRGTRASRSERFKAS
jgi:hypothetical protein